MRCLFVGVYSLPSARSASASCCRARCRALRVCSLSETALLLLLLLSLRFLAALDASADLDAPVVCDFFVQGGCVADLTIVPGKKFCARMPVSGGKPCPGP